MGDYSTVTLFLDSKTVAELRPQLEQWEFQPDYIHESKRTPTGSYTHPHMLVWDEARSGLENSDIALILGWLRDQKLPYRAVDDGCWGVWSEEEEMFDGQIRKSRPLRDGVPVLEEATLKQASKGLGLADIGAIVLDYFSDEPSRWP